MAFILDADAALRLLARRKGDPLLHWIEAEEVVPSLATDTLASVLHLIRTDPRLNQAQRDEMRRRWDALRDELLHGNGRSAQLASLDIGSAERLAELLGSGVATAFSDLDLVPVALALGHGWTILVGGDEHPYQEIDAWLQAHNPALAYADPTSLEAILTSLIENDRRTEASSSTASLLIAMTEMQEALAAAAPTRMEHVAERVSREPVATTAAAAERTGPAVAGLAFKSFP